MKNCAIVGINWGDEGKGRMVDFLAERYDVVVRYQGGNNAGHTIVNDLGEFKLNLLPSGIFRPETMNLLGPGVIVDIGHLAGELASVRSRGVMISPDNFRISNRATVVLPLHSAEDKLEEARLGKGGFGSTQRGVAPAYADRAYKKALRMGDLLHEKTLDAQLHRLLDWKNAVYTNGYGVSPYNYDEVLEWVHEYAEILRPYICDALPLLQSAHAAGKGVLFEAQLGALRDLDYGIYPYTSSSTPLAAYAPVGCGMPSLKVDHVVGTIKAYSTCVGAGPFVGELLDETGNRLREAGHEYGAATGRPRRVAWMDLVASRYGVVLQGATELALTKLDVLSGFESLPLCVAYKRDGEVLTNFPYTPELDACEPVYETMPGWQDDLGSIRRYDDLPHAARDYVERIEAAMKVPITFVSVGPNRDQLIIREDRHAR
ncbi:adenylosuccinate synthase [Eubacteriales bacterium OttesenSCG-928-A19]|nr:adenylosuccinate synthase [Eubacteriales bacterium OttesenSCG-928-A19]